MTANPNEHLNEAARVAGADAQAEAGAQAEARVDADADASAQQEAAAAAAALAERVAALETALAEMTEKWKRALAETENVRRIAARDREDAGKYAVTRFARDILSVADNLRRALDSMDKDARQSDPGLDALASGVELTERELLATLARYGITPIAAAAQPFDPNIHEALFEVPDDSVPHHTVVHVVEPGYMIHDRPLRPARVGVSKGGAKPTASQQEDRGGGDVIDFPKPGGSGAHAGSGGGGGEADRSGAGQHLDEEL